MDKSEQRLVERLDFLEGLAKDYKILMNDFKLDSLGKYFAHNARQFLGCIEQLAGDSYVNDALLPDHPDDYVVSVSQRASELYSCMKLHLEPKIEIYEQTARMNLAVQQILKHNRDHPDNQLHLP